MMNMPIWWYVVFSLWYLSIAAAFYLYGMDEIHKKFDSRMLIFCLLWVFTFPSSIVLALIMYLENKIREWWRRRNR